MDPIHHKKKTPQQLHQQHQQHQQVIGDRHLLPTTAKSVLFALRGGIYFTRRTNTFSRKGAWETAVKRGKGGFPAPSSWEPIDEEELRVMAENLLTPEVVNEFLELLPVCAPPS